MYKINKLFTPFLKKATYTELQDCGDYLYQEKRNKFYLGIGHSLTSIGPLLYVTRDGVCIQLCDFDGNPDLFDYIEVDVEINITGFSKCIR